MYHHMYDWNIVNCNVKQPIHLPREDAGGFKSRKRPPYLQRVVPREDAGGLSREYGFRIPNVS